MIYRLGNELGFRWKDYFPTIALQCPRRLVPLALVISKFCSRWCHPCKSSSIHSWARLTIPSRLSSLVCYFKASSESTFTNFDVQLLSYLLTYGLQGILIVQVCAYSPPSPFSFLEIHELTGHRRRPLLPELSKRPPLLEGPCLCGPLRRVPPNHTRFDRCLPHILVGMGKVSAP